MFLGSCQGRLLPLTGFGAAESGVNHCVMRSFVIIVAFVFVASWFAIVVPDFGSARIAALLHLRASQLFSPAEKRVIRAVRDDIDFRFPDRGGGRATRPGHCV